MGIDKALALKSGKAVAVIAIQLPPFGMTGLLDIAYNRAPARLSSGQPTTGHDGRQEHPGTGRTVQGEKTKKVDCFTVRRAGHDHVKGEPLRS